MIVVFFIENAIKFCVFTEKIKNLPMASFQKVVASFYISMIEG
jgi:catalase